MTATPNPVTFNYQAPNPSPFGTVQITPAVAFTARISTNVVCSGPQNCSAQSGQNVSGLFQISPGEGILSIGFDRNILGIVGNLGSQTWTGHVIVSANNYSDLDIPLVLNVGISGAITVTPSSLTLSAGVGTTTSGTLSLSSTTNVSYTVSAAMTDRPDAAWLGVSPPSGSVSQNPTLNVTMSAGALTQGSYRGTISILVGGLSAANVPVTFNVGATGTLTLSPAALSFQYMVGGSLPLTQYVTAQGTPATTYSVSVSSSGWLLVNGATSAGPFAIGTQLPVSVNVASLPQSAATYYGYLNYSTSDGKYAQMTVTLQVTTTAAGPLSTTQLAFSYPSGTLTQGVTLTGTGTYAAVPYVYSGSGWLSVSPSTGSLSGSTTFYVSVNPQLLATGTYTGAVSVSLNGQSVGTVSVMLTVGSGGTTSSVLVAPASLSFTVGSGIATTFPQQLAITGANSYSVQVASNGNWLGVTPTSGTAPATLSVTVNVGSLAVGTYTGTIYVTSGSFSQQVSVSLAIVTGAVVTTSPVGALVWNYQAGGAAPGSQSIYLQAVNNTAGTQLTFTATTTANWLTIGSGSGNVPGGFAMALNTANLVGGINNGTVTITVPGAANSPIILPVTVVVSGLGGVNLNPTALSFAAPVGGTAPGSQYVTLDVGAGNAFTASATSSGGWLSVTPTYGTSPATLTVSANPANLAAGTYTGTITVIGNGVSGQVSVTFVVGGGGTVSPTLSVSPGTLTFNAQQGGAAPAAQTVQVSSGGVAASFTVASNQSWLTVTPASASTPGSLTVSADPASLAAGTYTGTLTITAAGATNSPQTVSVTFNVTAPPQVQVSSNALSFMYRLGGPAPDAQSVQVSSTGAALSVTVATSVGWLSATPASGATPLALSIAASPGSLSPGTYSGTVTVSATGSSQNITVSLTVAGPLPTVTSVVNAASYQDTAISPGEIITIAGTALGPADLIPMAVSEGVVTISLGGVRVLAGGIPAPLLYVSSTQISAIVPYGIAGRTSTFVQVEYQGQRSNAMTLRAGTSAPGIFTADSSGKGPGAIVNPDGSLNSPGNGAARDSVVVLYVTGEGQTIPDGVDGRITTADEPEALPRPVMRVSVTIDGQPAEVSYAGAAPGMVAGVMQVNVRIPAAARSGDVPVVVTVGNASSQDQVTVTVR